MEAWGEFLLITGFTEFTEFIIPLAQLPNPSIQNPKSKIRRCVLAY
jgi:hypothetical protein